MSEPTIKQILHTADGITDKPMETKAELDRGQLLIACRAALENIQGCLREQDIPSIAVRDMLIVAIALADRES